MSRTDLGLNLSPAHLEKVLAILKKHAPRAVIWAYGSRVNGTGHEASDLDLVVRNSLDLNMEYPNLSSLKEAFVESDLPIRIDVMDWAGIPGSFRKEIERGYLVIQ